MSFRSPAPKIDVPELRSPPVVPWNDGAPLDLWQHLFPKAERVVVCPAKPYRQLLQAACLAGTLAMFCGAHFLHVYAGHLPNLCTMVWVPRLLPSICRPE